MKVFDRCLFGALSLALLAAPAAARAQAAAVAPAVTSPPSAAAPATPPESASPEAPAPPAEPSPPYAAPPAYPPAYAAPPAYPPTYGAPPAYAPPAYPPAYAPPAYPPAYAPPPGYQPRPYYPPPYSPYGAYPPAGASATEEPAHQGFYLSLRFGASSASFTGTNGRTGDKIAYSGGGVSFSVAMGGAIAPGFVLFGELVGVGSNADNLTFNGLPSTTRSATSGLGGFGIGGLYYFEPINLYLSAALTFLDSSVSDDNSNQTLYESNVGLGFHGMLGKEWWLSRHWGLGGAAEVIASPSMTDKNNPNVTWSATALSLVLSATYN